MKQLMAQHWDKSTSTTLSQCCLNVAITFVSYYELLWVDKNNRSCLNPSLFSFTLSCELLLHSHKVNGNDGNFHFTVDENYRYPHLTENENYGYPHLTVNGNYGYPHLTENGNYRYPHLTMNENYGKSHLEVNGNYGNSHHTVKWADFRRIVVFSF